MVSGRGADHFLLASELPRQVISEAGCLHLTAWSFFTDPPRAAAREAARLAREAGVPISFDPASFQMIHEVGLNAFLKGTTDMGISVLLPNYEEGSILTGEVEPERIAERLAELYPGALIMLKLDADGALVFENGSSQHIPPAPGRLVDATGAGDAFAGAFLSRWLTGESPEAAARFATRVSAWVIGRLGARPQGEWEEAVKQMEAGAAGG